MPGGAISLVAAPTLTAVCIMDHRMIALFIISCLVCPNNGDISCYVCATAFQQYPNRTIRSCTYFEETEDFETSCPYSTYCMKKTSELVIQNGEIIRVEERGCASQKLTHHKYENGQWIKEDGIQQELYQEGCFPEKELDLKAAKSQYCYCSSNYCNTGKRSSETSFFHHTDAMSVIFIFNVVKFMRNVR